MAKKRKAEHQSEESAELAARRASYEKEFVQAFIRPDKRERCTFLVTERSLTSKLTGKKWKRLGEYQSMLACFEHIMDASPGPVEHTQHYPDAELLSRLSELGAPKECYVLSLTSDWDGRFMSLEKAIRVLADGLTDTSMLLCIPGSLAYYYHGEMQILSGILRKVKS